ncbi:hypothetical protein KCU99_g10156, partial [Aureobasidium melanogenum]
MLTLPFKSAYTIHSHSQLPFLSCVVQLPVEPGHSLTLRQTSQSLRREPTPALVPARACQGQRHEAPQDWFDSRRTIHQESSSVSSIKPIGSGFSSPSRQTLLKDGPAFSTDTDPNIAETLFVRFGLIPLECDEAHKGTELVGLIESYVYAADDTPGCFTLYCRFEELRAATASKTMFESALTSVSFTFVDHHKYFGHDHTNARAQAVSAYDGQVEFTATSESMMNFNIKKTLRKPCCDFYFL